MINLRLIPHFQHQLTTVNAGAHHLVLRYIQELLGHESLKTKGIYTHLSKKSLANSKSPLNEIEARQRIENQYIKLNKNKQYIKEINALSSSSRQERIYTSCTTIKLTNKIE